MSSLEDWFKAQYGRSWGEGAAPSTLFSDLLEEDPEMAYFGKLQGQALTPNQRQYFQGQYGPSYQSYLGELGSQLESEQMPTMKWLDYLTQNPFTKRYAQLPPSLRPGSGTARFAPPTRWV